MCNMKNKPPDHGRIFFSNSSNNCVTKHSDILMCKMKLRRNNNKKGKKINKWMHFTEHSVLVTLAFSTCARVFSSFLLLLSKPHVVAPGELCY